MKLREIGLRFGIDQAGVTQASQRIALKTGQGKEFRKETGSYLHVSQGGDASHRGQGTSNGQRAEFFLEFSKLMN
jgi:hypothetical protein